MSLTIIVRDGHFLVSDGCEFRRAESCIEEGLSSVIKQDSSSRAVNEEKQSYLFRWNVMIAHLLYGSGKPLVLRCPVCDERYVLGKEDFLIGEEAYQKLNSKRLSND